MADKFKTFADAMAAAIAPTPSTGKPKLAAANDNKPSKKARIRNRSTLPVLRWLYDNHPDLAQAMADAVRALTRTVWDAEATDGELEIRPTVGEIVRAASAGKDDNGNPIWLTPEIKQDKDGNPYIQLGELKFKGNELVEYGRTKKGRRLEPRDRMTSRGDEPSKSRNPYRYIWLRGAIPSPMHSESYQRPFSGEPMLAPMYDPQRDVEANRATLQEFGVDGSVSFDRLPFPATKCPTAIAKGAEFLGGVVQSSGNGSSGALMWEAPDVPKGEVRMVVEAVAAGATLKDIGVRMGCEGARVDRMAKEIVTGAARALIAANDNKRKKIAA